MNFNMSTHFLSKWKLVASKCLWMQYMQSVYNTLTVDHPLQLPWSDHVRKKLHSSLGGIQFVKCKPDNANWQELGLGRIHQTFTEPLGDHTNTEESVLWKWPEIWSHRDSLQSSSSDQTELCGMDLGQKPSTSQTKQRLLNELQSKPIF